MSFEAVHTVFTGCFPASKQAIHFQVNGGPHDLKHFQIDCILRWSLNRTESWIQSSKLLSGADCYHSASDFSQVQCGSVRWCFDLEGLSHQQRLISQLGLEVASWTLQSNQHRKVPISCVAYLLDLQVQLGSSSGTAASEEYFPHWILPGAWWRLC